MRAELVDCPIEICIVLDKLIVLKSVRIVSSSFNIYCFYVHYIYALQSTTAYYSYYQTYSCNTLSFIILRTFYSSCIILCIVDCYVTSEYTETTACIGILPPTHGLPKHPRMFQYDYIHSVSAKRS